LSRYASTTEVSVERSRAEIEETLRRYGATSFHSGWEEDRAMIGFRIHGLFVRFVLPFPIRTDRRFTHKKVRGYDQKMSDLQSQRAYEQEMRSRWRALLLVIKAKLEATECKISSIEQEFLAFIVMPNQMTVGEWLADSIPQIKAGEMPKLMLAPKADDAEFEVNTSHLAS
jgi:hypothetical protein